MREPYKSLVEGLKDELRKEFKDRLVSLVVFGSVARGQARRESDIDLLIVVKNLPKSRLKRTELFMKAEERLWDRIEELHKKGYRTSFSAILKTPEEAEKISPLYLDMVEDAVILYDKDNFFANVLNRLKNKLEELGAERVWIGKKWYWRLKKDFKFGEVIVIE